MISCWLSSRRVSHVHLGSVLQENILSQWLILCFHPKSVIIFIRKTTIEKSELNIGSIKLCPWENLNLLRFRHQNLVCIGRSLIFKQGNGNTFRIHAWLCGYPIVQLSFVILCILSFIYFSSFYLSISIHLKRQAWILKLSWVMSEDGYSCRLYRCLIGSMFHNGKYLLFKYMYRFNKKHS